MERINVTQAARNFSDLLNRVYYQGISVELERNNKVVAVLSPAQPVSKLRMEDLNDFFASLPSLGEDAKVFAEDLKAIRAETQAESEAWE